MPVLQHGETEAEARVLRGLRLAVELSIVILIVEAFGAFFSRSLALTVDAVHNLPDILAFAASYTALRSTGAGASSTFTYGTHRFEVLAGLLNGCLVLGTGVVFGYESIASLLTRTSFAGPVDALWLLVAAVPTLALRVASMRALGEIPGRVRDLNLSSVLVHLWSDLAITGALLVAGVALLLRPTLGYVDAAGALVIAAILVYESLPLLWEGTEVLTDRTPRGVSVEAITRSALSVPGVTEVHDVHVWAVCSSLVCLTAHVGVRDAPLRECMATVQALRERMEKDFGILHATFEIEGPSTA